MRERIKFLDSVTTPGASALASLSLYATSISQSINASFIPPSANNCVYQTRNMILELAFLHKFGGSGESRMTMESIRAKNNGMAQVPRLGDEARCHGSPAKNVRHVRKNVPSDQSLSSPENAQTSEKAVTDKILSHLLCSISYVRREKHTPRCDQTLRLKEKSLVYEAISQSS